MSHRETQAEIGDAPSETTPLLPEGSENRQTRTAVRIRGILAVAGLFHARWFIQQQLLVIVILFFCPGESSCPGNMSHLTAVIVSIAISIPMTGFWTRMSDIRGRKIVLTFISAGMLLLDLVLAVVTFVSPSPKTFVVMYIVGVLVQSIFGGMMTVNGLAHSYIADGRPYDKRAIRFSFLDGIKMLAAYLANALLTLVTRKSQMSFYVLRIPALVISVVLLLGIIFCLEESLPELPDFTTPLLDDAKESLKGLLSPITTFITGGGPRQRDLFFVGLGVLAYSFFQRSHFYEMVFVALSYERSKLAIFTSIEPVVLFISYLAVIPIILYLSQRMRRARERTVSEILISRSINYLHIICAVLALAIPHVVGYILFGIILPGLAIGIFPLLYTIASINYELDHGVTRTGALYGALAVIQSLGEVLPVPMLIFALNLGLGDPSGSLSYIIRAVRLACLVVVAALLRFPGAQNPIVEMGPDESSAPRADVDSDGRSEGSGSADC